MNVLLALSWPAHKFHDDAQTWFKQQGRHKWATCPLTQTAFVRISSNPAFSRDAVTAQDALGALEANMKHPAHVFWPDAIGVTDALTLVEPAFFSHRQLTDAYLLGLALHYKGTLATFDTGIRSLRSSHGKAHDALVEIPHL